MNDDPQREDLFDARLRVALMQPPPYQPPSDVSHARTDWGARLIVAATATVAALVCIWFIVSQGKAETESPAGTDRKNTETKEPQGQGNGSLLSRVRSDKTRGATLTALQQRGTDGARQIMKLARQLTANTETDALRDCLAALGAMGPAAAPVVPQLRAAAAKAAPTPCLFALRALADLAPYHREQHELGRMTADSVMVQGRRLTTTKTARPGDFLHVRTRWRIRSQVRPDTSITALAKLLGDDNAIKRDVALDVLRFRNDASPAIVTALESILRETQPEFEESHWVTDPRPAVRRFRSSSHGVLRPKAAQLLLRLPTGQPARTTALAWIVRGSAHSAKERLGAAEMLGSAKWAGSQRVDFAIRSLMAAAKSDDLNVARAATAAIGQHGRDSLLAFALLEELEQHSDPTLRKQAKSSLRAIRQVLLGN